MAYIVWGFFLFDIIVLLTWLLRPFTTRFFVFGYKSIVLVAALFLACAHMGYLLYKQDGDFCFGYEQNIKIFECVVRTDEVIGYTLLVNFAFTLVATILFLALYHIEKTSWKNQ